jgi:putative hemolysin
MNRCAALTPVEPAIQKLLQVDRLAAMLHSARESDGLARCLRLLGLLDVTYRIDPADLSRIPASGPVVVTANHPFGFLEAFLLPAVLGRVRRDLKIRPTRSWRLFPNCRATSSS